jgi:hypothetical protein
MRRVQLMLCWIPENNLNNEKKSIETYYKIGLFVVYDNFILSTDRTRFRSLERNIESSNNKKQHNTQIIVKLTYYTNYINYIRLKIKCSDADF